METSFDFEDMPLSNPYEQMVGTWHEFEDTLASYMAGHIDGENVGDSLAAHIVTLPVFIHNFLAENEDSEDTKALHTLIRTILQLHQQPIRQCILANGFDPDEFTLVEDDEFEETTQEFLVFMKTAEELGNLPEGAEINVTTTLYENLKDLVVGNVASVLRLSDKQREAAYARRHEHIIDVGKTALGVFIGMAAFALLDSMKKR